MSTARLSQFCGQGVVGVEIILELEIFRHDEFLVLLPKRIIGIEQKANFRFGYFKGMSLLRI